MGGVYLGHPTPIGAFAMFWILRIAPNEYTLRMAVQNWDWVFHTLGWTLAGLGLLLGLRALFWDRSRGRKRCPKCWYSMEGAVKDDGGKYTCPECGQSIVKDRKLHNTRRRWRWSVVAGLLITMGLTGIVGATLQRDGWDALPTRVLIEALAFRGDKSLRDTLDSRLVDPNARRFYMGSPQDLDPHWKESALSERQWSRLAVQLSRMFGDSNSQASHWAVQSVSFGLPDPFPALPELKRKLKEGDLREREDAVRTLFLLTLARFRSDSTGGRRIRAEGQSCIADLVFVLELSPDDDLLAPYPTLAGFRSSGVGRVPGQLIRADSARSVLRAGAADALGSIGIENESAVAALERAATDTDEWVAHHAAQALKHIK